MSNTARLLIADDQPDVLEALRLLLSRENFALTMVASPAALVDQIHAAKWDVFTFAPDVVGLSIADVAGKGLPAALLMSSLQAAVRAFAHDASPPYELCASVNRLLCGQMIAGRFVTMVYLRLDAGRSTLAYANAGHNPPLLVRSTGEVEALRASGTVLGVFPDAEYVGAQVPLHSGDRLLLYTDGMALVVTILATFVITAA